MQQAELLIESESAFGIKRYIIYYILYILHVYDMYYMSEIDIKRYNTFHTVLLDFKFINN